MVCTHPLDKRCQVIQSIGGVRIWDAERCLICDALFVTMDDVKEVQKHLRDESKGGN